MDSVLKRMGDDFVLTARISKSQFAKRLSVSDFEAFVREVNRFGREGHEIDRVLMSEYDNVIYVDVVMR